MTVTQHSAIKLPTDLRKVVRENPNNESDLRAEIGKVKALPMSEGDYRALVRASVARMFAPGAFVANDDGSVTPPLLAIDATGSTHVKAIINYPAIAGRDPAFVEGIQAELEGQIVARYRGVTEVATAEEKRKRIDAINARILEGQRLEVAAVNALRAAGDYVPLRAGLDIRAVLGVDGPSPAKRRR